VTTPEPTPGHKYGVRIPPDEGDANYRGESVLARGWTSPVEPVQLPASAPNTPPSPTPAPPATVHDDLHARMAEAGLCAVVPGAPRWSDVRPEYRAVWLAKAKPFLAFVEAELRRGAPDAV
jgi:hypothetical protein